MNHKDLKTCPLDKISDCLSRSDAIADFEKCNRENPVWKPQRVKTLLMRTPTVDAVPVVRCRDCALFEEIGTRPGNEGAPFGYCYHWDYEQGMSPNQVDGNDFCSYGERKLEAEGEAQR